VQKSNQGASAVLVFDEAEFAHPSQLEPIPLLDANIHHSASA
jgi:hypothetical protein